jgi:glycosyltransferase involved in cell wall biosynthesis
MRILVDYRPALRARSGVGEYVHELVRAYSAAHDDEIVVFTSSWKDRPPAGLAAELGASVVDRRVPVRLLNLLWHRASWPAVERLAGAIDVAHSLHPLLIPARRAAQVVTVHDLFFLTDPDRTRREIRRDYPALAGVHARRADAVITPSAYTRSLVMDRFGVAPGRVWICPPGAPAWRRLGREPNAPADGYLLFVGTLEPRKNIGLLLDAYALLIARMPRAPRLRLAGRATPDARRWLDRLDRAPLAGRVEHLGYVPAAGREDLYAGARALVLPSFDEGFGLPALEAMSAGVPVVASNRGALPEVLGPAGAQVDPEDVDGWSFAIERVLCDRPWAAGLAAAGLERARNFRWHESAARLRQIYLAALERRRAP